MKMRYYPKMKSVKPNNMYTIIDKSDRSVIKQLNTEQEFIEFINEVAIEHRDEVISDMKTATMYFNRFSDNVELSLEDPKLMVISPDDIPIHHSESYPTYVDAVNAFNKWMKNFERQGYYSSNNGRIPLDDLFINCKIVLV